MKFVKALSATMLLTVLCACLPEDLSRGGSSDALEQTREAGALNVLGEALTNYALRSQYAMVNDDKWRADTYPEGRISLGRVDRGSLSPHITSAFCRDNAGRGFHLTWPRSAPADAGRTVAALSRRISADMLGTATRSGVIALKNGQSITLSRACLSSESVDIPTAAPVIAMAVALPADAAIAGRTKVLFETVACSAPRQKGYELVKVIYRYDAAGRVGDGYPRRSVISTTCAEQRPTDAQVSLSSAQILSSAGGLGSSGVANLIARALGEEVPCARTRQFEVTGYDDRGRPIRREIESANSCAEGIADTNFLGSYGDEDIGGDYWEPNDERGYCQGGRGSDGYTLFDTPGIWSWSDWAGEYTSKRWIDRTRTITTDGREAAIDAVRGPWVGDVVDCSRQENFRANCADIPAVRALGKPYASNDMWVNVNVLNDSNRHFDADWIGDFFGSTIGCWFGCDKLTALDVDIMNKDYFDGLEVSGELHMRRAANITRWEDAERFRPYIPREWEKAPWVFNDAGSTCAVSVRTPLFACRGATTSRPDISPRGVSAANVLRHDLLARLYTYPRTSDGAVMTTLDPEIDRQYLIVGGKYPSEYSINRLHWAVKSCSIKGCDTDHFERPVYRVYVDNDRIGYQKVLDQGFYYANKKIMYDPERGFYMTDRGLGPSARDRTVCEVVRLLRRDVHQLSYTVKRVDSWGDGEQRANYEPEYVRTEFIPMNLENYIAVTRDEGYSTGSASSNICINHRGAVSFCGADPYLGMTTISCAAIGMYDRTDCVGYNSSGDDVRCTRWQPYCSSEREDSYGGGGN